MGDAERRALAAIERRARAVFSNAAVRADPDRFAEAVAALHPDLLGECLDDGCLVVRARRRALAPLAEWIAALAPDGVSILSSRPAESVPRAVLRVRALTGVDFTRARVRIGFGRGHLLDVVVLLPGGAGSDAEHEAATELVWAIAGESFAETWIGSVDVVPAPRGSLPVVGDTSSRGYPLTELAGLLVAATEGLELPAEPLYAAGDGAWTLFELDPEPAEDFPLEDDLALASTRAPELLKCYLEGAPFSSLRFSRYGELFFHLKYEGLGEPQAQLQERARLEDVIDRKLVAARAGRVVGGGLGLRYSYVHLALSDVPRGLEIVRAVGKQEGLPPRSWLEPFDTDLAAQWIEIWPDSVPPPGHSLPE
nr:MAG: hypothetical protein DIU78_19230 [Pseudomonadota bacterium]